MNELDGIPAKKGAAVPTSGDIHLVLAEWLRDQKTDTSGQDSFDSAIPVRSRASVADVQDRWQAGQGLDKNRIGTLWANHPPIGAMRSVRELPEPALNTKCHRTTRKTEEVKQRNRESSLAEK